MQAFYQNLLGVEAARTGQEPRPITACNNRAVLSNKLVSIMSDLL